MASPPFYLIILLYYSAGLAFVKRLDKAAGNAMIPFST